MARGIPGAVGASTAQATNMAGPWLRKISPAFLIMVGGLAALVDISSSWQGDTPAVQQNRPLDPGHNLSGLALGDLREFLRGCCY